MSRKDFELIAGSLKFVKPSEEAPQARRQWESTVDEFAKSLRSTNSNFDSNRFRRACGDERG